MEKHTELTQLPISERWLWILGPGVTPVPIEKKTFRWIPLTTAFKIGRSVRTGFDRKNPISSAYAYYEFKEIEHQLGHDDFVVYTDGSFKTGASGCGVAIFQNNNLVHEITTPTGDMPIAYAELYAIYTALKWFLHLRESRTEKVHFFVDNIYARDALCNTLIPRKYFFLIQDIKHIASVIQIDHDLFIHWIPSHLETHTSGQFYIPGNCHADRLANIAREQAQAFIDTDQNFHSHESIRNQILQEAASLIWTISTLLEENDNFSDGPSSDDFSSANADQIILLEDNL